MPLSCLSPKKPAKGSPEAPAHVGRGALSPTRQSFAFDEDDDSGAAASAAEGVLASPPEPVAPQGGLRTPERRLVAAARRPSSLGCDLPRPGAFLGQLERAACTAAAEHGAEPSAHAVKRTLIVGELSGAERSLEQLGCEPGQEVVDAEADALRCERSDAEAKAEAVAEKCAMEAETDLDTMRRGSVLPGVAGQGLQEQVLLHDAVGQSDASAVEVAALRAQLARMSADLGQLREQVGAQSARGAAAPHRAPRPARLRGDAVWLLCGDGDDQSAAVAAFAAAGEAAQRRAAALLAARDDVLQGAAAEGRGAGRPACDVVMCEVRPAGGAALDAGVILCTAETDLLGAHAGDAAGTFELWALHAPPLPHAERLPPAVHDPLLRATALLGAACEAQRVAGRRRGAMAPPAALLAAWRGVGLPLDAAQRVDSAAAYFPGASAGVYAEYYAHEARPATFDASAVLKAMPGALKRLRCNKTRGEY